jgi:hypothetical protein
MVRVLARACRVSVPGMIEGDVKDGRRNERRIAVRTELTEPVSRSSDSARVKLERALLRVTLSEIAMRDDSLPTCNAKA